MKRMFPQCSFEPDRIKGRVQFLLVELLARYSNRSDLLEPLVKVLDRIEANDQTNEPGVQSVGNDHAWRVSDRLTEADIRELVASFQSGTTKLVLAERYGIGLSTVKRLLKQHHARGNPPPQS